MSMGEYINTNDYKNDFSLASPTPINSALTVAMYIMKKILLAKHINNQ